MRIMIVEDNAMVRQSVRDWITSRMPDVIAIHECTDGIEALEMYAELRPDWVLMDIKLPSLDGLQATRRILRSYPDAQIIILTNYSDPSFREEAERIGARAYVLKENLTDIEKVIHHGAEPF